MKASGDSVGAFFGWCVVGAALALAIFSLLTIGPFVMLLALVLIALLLWRVDFGWAMAGMISGAALPVLYVAWLNRHGPGEFCTRTATSISCDDQWSPWPFVTVGVVLVVTGVVVFVLRRGR
jgi:hypothetical protein